METEAQIIELAVALLKRRRCTTLELSLGLRIGLKQAANVIQRIRARGGLQMDTVPSEHALGRREICRYWLHGAYEMPKRPVTARPLCEVCHKNQAHARGMCRRCDELERREAPPDLSHLRVPRAEIPPLYRVCDGREFEVVFDGRVR